MPYYFEIDSTNRVLRCRFEGGINDEVLKEFYFRAVQHVAQANPRAAIADFSAVTSMEISANMVRQLAMAAPVVPDMSVPRFIIAPLPKAFGMARMFELEGQHVRPNLHVVRSIEAACAILGIQELNFAPIEP